MGAGMRRTLRVEIYKLATMRMALVVAAAGLALVAMFTLVTLIAAAPAPRDGLPGLGEEEGQRLLLTSGAFATVALVVLGILVTAGEYRHRTVVASLLVEPRRGRLLWAKVALLAVVGLLVGAGAAAIAVGGGLAGLEARRIDIELEPGEIFAIAAGTACYASLTAVMGVAVGALVRDQIVAVTLMLGVLWVVDPLLSQVIETVDRFGPGGLGKSLTGAPVDGGPEALLAAPALAAATLVLVFAAVRRQRADVFT